MHFKNLNLIFRFYFYVENLNSFLIYDAANESFLLEFQGVLLLRHVSKLIREKLVHYVCQILNFVFDLHELHVTKLTVVLNQMFCFCRDQFVAGRTQMTDS